MNYEAIIAQKNAKIEKQSAEIKQLWHLVDQLRKQVFGHKSERYIPVENPAQLNLFGAQDQTDTPEEADVAEKETITYEREKKKSNQKGRQLLANCDHLPVEEIIIEPEHEAGDICIGEEITDKLAKKPAKLYIKRIIRRKYKKAGTDVIVIAPVIEEPIDRCEADISLLSDIVVSKYVDHIPEYRQQQIYKREGVMIPPSTMNGWVHQLCQYMKHMSDYIKQKILESGYIQQDESTIRVMDGKKQGTHTGYMWVMGSPELKYVCFEYRKGRGQQTAVDNFKDYKGQLQTDGYAVYENIDKLYGDIAHFQCWAHGRRKFIESKGNDKARSEYVLEQIQQLYAIEQQCREDKSTHEERRIARQAAKPILDNLKEWLNKESVKVTPKSPIGKAISYLLARWEKFTKYTDYGKVEIDNNIIENAIRPLALGRKNYLFAGNHEAATNISYYYTVFGTCKAQGVDPYAYMVWFLSKVAGTKTTRIGGLAPDAFLKLK